jgi:peptidoglycan/LPS O-acetylase OafA/YrhL
LRAVAVIAVLAFHTFPEWAPGGFTGVDVFFVISGFLISGIILDDLRFGRFTFADFYWRRIRRIFPALVLVLCGSLAMGWLILLPDEYTELGKHVAAGAAFVSNVALWREVGYFDHAAELKPLLHLWSLGVEEQYYVLWPLILFLLRGRRHAMLWMIVALGSASFALNVSLVSTRPSAVFYLPVTRLWELLAGSLLACIARPSTSAVHVANLKSSVGVALVAAGFALIDSDKAFPGWLALVPVLGSVLVISAGPNAWLNRAILSQRALVFVGLISYPLYLWHWPLLTYARIIRSGEAPAAERMGVIILSVALAWATYRLIELNVRSAWTEILPRRRMLLALTSLMAAVAVCGLAARHNHLEPRSAAVPLAREISDARQDWKAGGDRIVPGDTREAVLFFGDSHMQQYWPRLERLVIERRTRLRTVILKTRNGCTPIPAIERTTGGCSRFVADGFERARADDVETVVIAASWVGLMNRPDYYRAGDPDRTPLEILAPGSAWVLEGLERTLHELTANGKAVVIVLSSPRGSRFDPASMIERDLLTFRARGLGARVRRAELTAESAPIDERLKRIAANVGATIVDPADWLCTPVDCATSDQDGKPLYKDASHLRASTARERFAGFDSFVLAPDRERQIPDERAIALVRHE